MPEIPVYDAACSRRGFLKLAGLATATLALPHPAPAAPAKKPFEVSASLYAWDLHDEGIERILDNLQGMAAVNSVYLIALMHYEKRPLTSPVFPHNPVRKTFQAEDSRVYWHPDLKRYGRIKPRPSAHDWLVKTDWLTTLTQAARKRGLKTGVELSHTVLDAERLKNEFLDCAQRDIHGKPRVVWGRGFPICPNHPDVRDYVLAIYRDLTANHDVDYVQSCMQPMMPGDATKGGCFCDACMKAAKASGVDLARIKAALLDDPTAQPALGEWQQFRRDSMTRFYKTMHDGIHAIRAGVDLRFNDAFRKQADWGYDLTAMKPCMDSVRLMDYTEQYKDGKFENKRLWIEEARAQLGAGFPLLSAVAVRPQANPERIRQGVRIAVKGGVDGITLGHYDGAEFPMLRAVRAELEACGIR